MSKKEITAKGEVTDKNEFRIYEREYFKGQVINNFKGKKIKIIVELEEKYVSNPQLRYYWGVVIKLVQQKMLENGNRKSREYIDQTLRESFLYEESMNFVTGEITKRPMALNSKETTVSTKRMIQYFEEIQCWAIEKIDCYIPDPNEEVKNHGLVEPGQAA